jgi:hypothetical protein
MGKTGKGVVIPFQRTVTGGLDAPRGWMFGSARVQQLGTQIAEEIERAEEDLKAVEAALEASHPAPAKLGSFLRGELSREENRAVVRHLLTGCPDCAAVLRSLLRHADLMLASGEAICRKAVPGAAHFEKYPLEEMRRLIRVCLGGRVSFEGEESF